MKHVKFSGAFFLILLAVLLCLSCCAAEEDDLKEGEAVLFFSSFAGGGYEYSVRVDDPSIVRCGTRYVYEEHAEEIDGASFDYIVTFTGLKPGSTTATVSGRSPIMENEDSIYTVSVDEDLHVTLTPVRAISCLDVYRNGEIYYDSYRITMEEDGYYVSVSEADAEPFSAEAAEALMDVIDRYDVAGWDGFSESTPFVLDGEGFRLDLQLTDGTRVHAAGDNAFPEHYFDAMGEMWEILTDETDPFREE